MVNDLHFCVDIVVCPTLRESDGLAMSSRNRYLSTIQRQDALALSQALFNAKKMVEAGTRSTDRVIAETTHVLGQRRRIRLIYAQIVDRCTMEQMKEILPGKSLLAIAAWVDEVRLIDNILL
jgi:pantoate--beta-alanine ligase